MLETSLEKFRPFLQTLAAMTGVDLEFSILSDRTISFISKQQNRHSQTVIHQTRLHNDILHRKRWVEVRTPKSEFTDCPGKLPYILIGRCPDSMRDNVAGIQRDGPRPFHVARGPMRPGSLLHLALQSSLIAGVVLARIGA